LNEKINARENQNINDTVQEGRGIDDRELMHWIFLGPAISAVLQLLFLNMYLQGWQPFLSGHEATILDYIAVATWLPALPAILVGVLVGAACAEFFGQTYGDPAFHAILILFVLYSVYLHLIRWRYDPWA
jgi:hypothetical protein